MEKRVLFVITGLGWGGAESQVIELASGLRDRGWAVQVASLLSQAHRRDSLESLGIPVHTLGMRRGVPDPRAIWRLAAVTRNFQPSIVHAHMIHANILTRVTRIIVRMPVLITSAHSVNEGGGWRQLAYRLTDSLADCTTNVSHAAVEQFIEDRAASPERIQYVPNGISFSKFQRSGEARARIRNELGLEDDFAWLSVGRLDPAKDYPTMLDALAKVVDTSQTLKLIIVGDGPLRDEIKKRAERLGLANFVHFLGIRSDIPALMSAADAYLMSSAWEGLPMVLLEAAASALPIVATDVGGNSQIVRNGLTGELVPAGDSAALAGAMLRMMERNESERAAMGANGRAYVEKEFGMDSVLERWEEIYEELWKRRFGSKAKRP